MLCEISDFHSRDYEEFRLMGYKKWVCTSQDTHYFSATESNRLMLYKTSGFHGDYEEFRLLRCGTVWILLESRFRGKLFPPSVRWKESATFFSLIPLILRLEAMGSLKHRLQQDPHGTISQKTTLFSATAHKQRRQWDAWKWK
jgi:hypothetical protein